jgi:hypothetical protein
MLLHSSAGNALEPHKRQAYAAWLNLMPAMFPCDVCGQHLAEGLKTYPVEKYLGSAERLLLHSYILHDAANNHFNAANPDNPRKKSPSWEEVKAKFLAIPSPEPVHQMVPQPIRQPFRQAQAQAQAPKPAPKSAASSSSSASGPHRVMFSHPAFDSLKNHFQPTRGRWQ